MDASLTLHKPAIPIIRRDHPLARGLVGAWPIVEASGEFINDYSGNANKATWNGPSILRRWGAGPHGAIAKFDGTNDFANIASPNALDLTAELTLAAWINPTTVSSTMGIFGNGNSGGTSVQWALATSAAGKINYLHNSGSAFQPASNTTLVAGTWYHVAAVRTGSTGAWAINFYLNGVFDGLTTSANNPSATQSSAIGAIGALTSNRFNGSLEGITVYNRALAAGEMRELYADPWVIYKPKRFYLRGIRNPNPVQPVTTTNGFGLYLPSNVQYSDYKKPVRPQINRAHPLASKLAAAWGFTEGAGLRVQDFSQNNRRASWAYNSTTPIWSTTARGRSLDSGGNSKGQVTTDNAPYFNFWGADWSIFSYLDIHDPTAAPAASRYYFGLGNSAAGAWVLGQSATSGTISFYYIDIDLALDESQFLTGKSWPGSGLHSLLLTGRNKGGTSLDVSLYVDGDFKATNNVNPGSDSNASGLYTLIGSNIDVNKTSNSGHLVQYVWMGRVLMSGEARDLHQNPFALIRPRKLVVSGVSSATPAVSTFVPHMPLMGVM